MDQEQEIVRTAVKALLAIGITNGPSHVEVKLTGKGPRIIEVNGRPGGDNISSDLLVQAFGINIFEATVNYYLDNPIDLHKKHHRAASIAYVTADRDGTFERIEGLEELSQHANVVRSHVTVSAGDAISIARSSDDRLGYLITTGDTAQEAKELALTLVASLKVIYRHQEAEIAQV
ncbi:argininosuccinate lyase [compost metagenome]